MELSEATWEKTRRLFPADQQQQAGDLLRHDCADNLPFCRSATPESLERIRFAALKRSGGDLERLGAAVRQAQKDWRDLLVAAGFGHSTKAHLDWQAD